MLSLAIDDFMLPLHCYVNVGADERGNRGDVITPARFWLDLHPCLLIFPFHKSISTLRCKVLNKTIKTFVISPFRALARVIWRSWTAGYFTGDGVELNTGQAAGARGGRLCRGSLCDAPLTACALNGKVWGDALVTGVKVTLTVALGWLEVASGTAQTILPQILEEVPGETHVDPGVTAAVEAGQQHGDDEGRGCRRWDSRQRDVTTHLGTDIPDDTLTITWRHQANVWISLAHCMLQHTSTLYVPDTILSFIRASCLIRRRRGAAETGRWTNLQLCLKRGLLRGRNMIF